ncbi:MAG: glutamine--tRNA ligase/YqeY domain fusion protein [Clostridia bacterium]|nr:glutamine--tRNA ligase/YqeY domain fusion protein [Clostridia bacterium]
MENITPSNFIEQAIIEDIKEKKLKKIVTRFPPEPNGYTHIGHAKAICIDFLTAEKFNGYTNLRMDDTNPSKESEHYVKALMEDIKWLGFKWKKLYYASDYYPFIYDCAIDLIKQGKAFVCDMTADEISANRGTLTDPGKESPYRNRSVEENLKLFEDMRAGKFKDGEKTLRAKIDMAHPNINMRDPVIYRIMHISHFRQGNKWCIYPMYDFAHPLSDAYEGVTHSLCSLEFEDHRPLYNWFIDNCTLITGVKPRQIEFARLNIDGTVISKRYFHELIEKGYVDGWDDPRLPTLASFKRKGYTPTSIREFCTRIGVAKSNSLVQPHILEACIREELNRDAMRVVAVIDPLKINITNYDKVEDVMISNNPTIENSKKHPVKFSKELYIEKEDFMLEPTPKFFRLTPNGYVRLMGAYVIRCDEVVMGENGEIDHLNCSIIPDAKEQGIKPKGTIHWLSRNHSEKIVTRKFFNLLKEGEVYEKGMLDRIVNPNSMVEKVSYIEPFATKQKGNMQFVRMGYYIEDCKLSKPGNRVYLETVSLKDSK